MRIGSKIFSYVYLLNLGHEDGERSNKEELNEEQNKEDVGYIKIPFVNKPSLGKRMMQQVSAVVFYHQAYWVNTFPLQTINNELLCMFHYCSITFIIGTLGCFTCT